MTLLREIQDAAASDSVPVSSLLRRAQILAVRLGHAPLRTWARNELVGYSNEADVPDYRKLSGTQVRVLGEFISPAGILSNVPLASSDIPDEQLRDYLFKSEIWSPVAELESLVSAGSSGEPIGIPWTSDEVTTLRAIWPALSTANRRIAVNTIAGILDQTRNRLLDFSLEIERANPQAGEADSGTHPVPLSTVTNIFNNTINGGSNIVTNAAHDATVTVSRSRIEAALPTLEAELEAAGVPNEEISTLEPALREDGDQKAGELGASTRAWIGRLATKLATGTITIGNDAEALHKIVNLIVGIFS